MISYTTCRDCGGLLQVTNNDTVHPTCTPKPTKVERLTLQWRALAEANDTDTTDMLTLEAQIEELDTRPPRLLDAALRYAQWGWPVFPLKTHAKVPATRNGFKDATTDPDRIRAWWGRHPDSNIGLPTGLAFDVIDIDVPEGPISLAKILDTVDPKTGRGLLPDAHGLVATASGGSHYYITVRGGGNKAAIMPGIDIRGIGGYVVAPPSTLGERGHTWSWAIAPSPAITTVTVSA